MKILHTFFLEEGQEEAIRQRLKDLLNAFYKETNINLYLCYHNSSDDGSRYDEVDGAFWQLAYGDILQLTPSAQDLLNRGIFYDKKYWVTYG